MRCNSSDISPLYRSSINPVIHLDSAIGLALSDIIRHGKINIKGTAFDLEDISGNTSSCDKSLYNKCFFFFVIKQLLWSEIRSTHSSNQLYLSPVDRPDQHDPRTFTVIKRFWNIVSSYITVDITKIIIIIYGFHGKFLSTVVVFPSGTTSQIIVNIDTHSSSCPVSHFIIIHAHCLLVTNPCCLHRRCQDSCAQKESCQDSQYGSCQKYSALFHSLTSPFALFPVLFV